MSDDSTDSVRPMRVADHPFFRGLDEDFVQLATSRATDHSFKAGDIIIQEGKIAHEFWLIFQGKVALEIASPGQPLLTIQTLGPGEALGWSWLSPPYRWRFDARAVTATRALAISAKALRDAFEAEPEIGYRVLMRLLPVIGERRENTRGQIVDLHVA